MSKKFIQQLSLFLIFVFLICILANFSNAQSGRKIPEKSKPETTEILLPEPKPEAAPTPTPVEPLHKLKVFSNIRTTFASQFIFPERMHRWVVERLSNSSLLDVSMGSYASLGEAKKIAKSETETFIVLVELDEESFPSPSRQSSSQGDVVIKYFVLSPGTGKTQHSGSIYIYPQFISSRDKVINQKRLCYPEVSERDLYLLDASFETAERILIKFKLPIPPYKCAPKI